MRVSVVGCDVDNQSTTTEGNLGFYWITVLTEASTSTKGGLRGIYFLTILTEGSTSTACIAIGVFLVSDLFLGSFVDLSRGVS